MLVCYGMTWVLVCYSMTWVSQQRTYGCDFTEGFDKIEHQFFFFFFVVQTVFSQEATSLGNVLEISL